MSPQRNFYTQSVVCPFVIYLCRPVRTFRHHNDDRDTKSSPSSPSRGGSGIGASRSGPRLNIGAATKQILSGIGHGATQRTRESRRSERADGAPTGEKVTGNQHPLEQNHIPRSGEQLV